MQVSPPGQTEQKVRRPLLRLDSPLAQRGGLAFGSAFPQTALAAQPPVIRGGCVGVEVWPSG